MPDQTYASHRVLPTLHILVGAALLLNACYLIYALVHAPACGSGLAAASGVALLSVWHAARRNAQLMQDRIIRLEMQVRLRLLLPAERHGEIARLGLKQLVALRFAGDVELPALVQRVVSGELSAPDAIKRAVVAWQPDHLRV
jgi:hypothetical protein